MKLREIARKVGAMPKIFLALLIAMVVTIIAYAAEMTITDLRPQVGDFVEELTRRSTKSLALLTEAMEGYGTNQLRISATFSGSVATETNINIGSFSGVTAGNPMPVTNVGGTFSGSVDVTNTVTVVLADTNIGATIVGGTITADTNVNLSSIGAGVRVPVYTPTDTNLNVALANTNVGATILGTPSVAISQKDVGVTNLVYVEGSVGITNTPTVTLSNTNMGVVILGGTNTIEATSPFPIYTPTGTNLNVTIDQKDVGVTNLVYVEGSVGITNTPAVTISQKDMGITNNVAVVGLTKTITVIPYITNAAYSDGDAGSYVFALDVGREAGKHVQLQRLFLLDKDDEGMAMDIAFFDRSVTLAVPGDAWNVSDADMAYCIGYVSIGSSDWVDLGGNRVAAVNNLNLSMLPSSGTTVYAAIRSRGTSTFTATNDVQVTAIVYQD